VFGAVLRCLAPEHRHSLRPCHGRAADHRPRRADDENGRPQPGFFRLAQPDVLSASAGRHRVLPVWRHARRMESPGSGLPGGLLSHRPDADRGDGHGRRRADRCGGAAMGPDRGHPGGRAAGGQRRARAGIALRAHGHAHGVLRHADAVVVRPSARSRHDGCAVSGRGGRRSGGPRANTTER
jgi:hypothetical protein